MDEQIAAVLAGAGRWAVVEGEALATLQAMPDASVDAVVTDPPYPEIDRDYGRMTEAGWMALMQPLAREMRRVLKPRGSAVLILQPNSERVGRMRGWLWRFLAWCVDEWNVVQDAYWWNHTAMPGAYAGLMRPSVKFCVWLGDSDCYRSISEVLWSAALGSIAEAAMGRVGMDRMPSGRTMNRATMRAVSAATSGPVISPSRRRAASHTRTTSASTA